MPERKQTQPRNRRREERRSRWPRKSLQRAPNNALDEYLRYMEEGRFQEAAESLEALRKILRELNMAPPTQEN